MTRTNSCNFLVDFTGTKHFETLVRKKEETSFCRLVGFVHGVNGSRQADGLRFLVYGPRADIVYATVQKGSRCYVMSHVQIRTDTNNNVYTEFVVEDIQYISGCDLEAGEVVRRKLVEAGVLKPSPQDPEYQKQEEKDSDYDPQQI